MVAENGSAAWQCGPSSVRAALPQRPGQHVQRVHGGELGEELRRTHPVHQTAARDSKLTGGAGLKA
jgi:hypothetical protein